MIYTFYLNINDDHECSSICMIEEGSCDLFTLIGTICYLGNTYLDNEVVLTSEIGEFHFKTGIYR